MAKSEHVAEQLIHILGKHSDNNATNGQNIK